jgi:N-acetyl sugar amidotransferase
LSESTRECTRCVMGEEDRIALEFNEAGVCSLCCSWEKLAKKHRYEPEREQRRLANIVRIIRQGGEGKPYDSVLGISGGVDSTYAAYQAKQLGLRPLVVHFDNGWNSELAVQNIENICKKLGFDLYSHVVDWREFRDLHRAYLLASVIDVEIPTDHGIQALLVRQAASRGVRAVISGMNFATEGLIPPEWVWDKRDLLNLRAIHRRYGTVPLRTFPTLGFFRNLWYHLGRGIRVYDLLDYLPYDKEQAKEIITRELGWRDYGGKHHESIFTRFYQGYILPRKFGVDKRKAHLSSLICAGQITREQALAELAKPPYDPKLMEQDRIFVIKKFGFAEAEFEALMRQPPVPHTSFPTYARYHYRYHEAFGRSVRPGTRLLRKVVGREK